MSMIILLVAAAAALLVIMALIAYNTIFVDKMFCVRQQRWPPANDSYAAVLPKIALVAMPLNAVRRVVWQSAGIYIFLVFTISLAASESFASERFPNKQFSDAYSTLKRIGAISLLETDLRESVRFPQAAFSLDSVNAPTLTATNNVLRGDSWNMNLRVPLSSEFSSDDEYFILFDARTLYAETESQQGQIELLIEHKQNYRKQLYTTIQPSGDWRVYGKQFKAQFDMRKGDATLGFNFGLRVQTVQLRKLILFKLPKNYAASKLKALRTPVTYNGQEKDARWRTEAAKRIEKLRKVQWRPSAELMAQTLSYPLELQFELHRHDFGFGSAVKSHFYPEQHSKQFVSPGDRKQYLAIVQENFRHNTLENALKWPNWKNNRSKYLPLKAIEWHKEQSIPLRGHNLIWPGWNKWEQGLAWDYTPRSLYEGRDDATFLRKEIDAHFKDILNATNGGLIDWDVINEPRVNHSVMDRLGMSAMAEWFCTARKYAPNTKLYLNDYGILPGGGNKKNLDILIEHVKLIQKTTCQYGRTLDGIGLQGHFGENPTAPEALWKILDRLYSATGLPIKITEFDIESDNEEFQSAYTHDFYTAMFAHPAVDAIIIWGFWEGAIWKPSAAMWRKDWTIKPNGRAMQRLVNNEWRSPKIIRIDNAKELKNLQENGVDLFTGSYKLSVREMRPQSARVVKKVVIELENDYIALRRRELIESERRPAVTTNQK